jgi:putative acetyltransferase
MTSIRNVGQPRKYSAQPGQARSVLAGIFQTGLDIHGYEPAGHTARSHSHESAGNHMTAPEIRRSQPMDCLLLVPLWERSVRATHSFLTETDIACYRPLVEEFLAGESLELWVLTDSSNVPIGFLGLSAHAIEALFLEPVYRRHGYGRCLVQHAQQLRSGPLTVDVNEQNDAARAFYEALGFVVVGRSPLDETGRPHPLLHLRRQA